MKITLTPRVIGAHKHEFKNKTEFINWATAKYSYHVNEKTNGDLYRYSVRYIVDEILPYCYYYLKTGKED